MGKINMTRVLLGGLVAGLIINVFESVFNLFVVGNQTAAAMRALGKSGEFSGGQIAVFIVMGFVIGILTVRLYAAIRPRHGAGPKTAIRAGLAMWVIGNLLPNTGIIVMDLFPLNLMIAGMAVGLCEIVLAALAGAALYKEEETPMMQSSAARA
jgi:hypothetical protein